MRSVLYISLSFFIAAFLTACSLSPKDVGKSYMFALMPAELSFKNKSDEVLIVALPTAAPELDTYRIALIKNNNRWDYYAGARWADFMPLLVQGSLTKTIERSHLVKHATTDQSGITGDKILKIEISSFHAKYKNGAKKPVITIHLKANLRNRHNNISIASFDSKAEVVAESDNISSIHKAFITSFDRAQKYLVYKLNKNL